MPVFGFSSEIVSVTPPLLYAITGVPLALASTGTIPKSSSCTGNITAFALSNNFGSTLPLISAVKFLESDKYSA